MSAAYTTLATIIGLLILFLYLSWLYVSAKFVWIKDNDNSGLKKNPRQWKKFRGLEKRRTRMVRFR